MTGMINKQLTTYNAKKLCCSRFQKIFKSTQRP